ncbi:MAG: restriction endonuclease subunit S [Janthinobacterium svalbardensis]|uniref:restriction endonuclease subunit S n=1 Tax=Janthinobacterium svalbardensis TaxID=368607 RepID=UPI001ABF810A|nr:restriction endonuclease subunit S [Janthinobacterium svalbardensis]
MSELQIPTGWIRTNLAALGEYVNGFAFNERYWSKAGLPIVRIAQITGTQDVVDRFAGRLPSSYRLESGDLIFSWSGTLAVVRWQGGAAWLNQHLFKVIPARAVERLYLFHILQKSVAEMDKRAHGSTMKHIKRGELSEFAVVIPEGLAEQAALARILDTLDTTIRQTEAIIEKLKLVKQGLLHDLLTRGIDANGELRPPQSQAPHLYKHSPLGWIPVEWSAGPLSDSLDGRPKNGYSPQAAGRWTGSQMLGLGCLTPDGFRARQLKDAPVDDVLLRSALLSNGDFLISRANTRDLVGLVGIYRDVGTPCYYPDLMMRLSPSTKTSAAFLEVVLGSPSVRRQIQASASGTSSSMVKISSLTVMNLSVAIPDAQEQNRILDTLAAATAHINGETQFIETQRKIKLGLSDDLLTGRVRVTELLETLGA